MKSKLILLIIVSVFLASCSALAPESTLIPVSTLTKTPILTPTQTSTPLPNHVPIPSLVPSPTLFAGISHQLVAFQKELFGHIFISKINGQNEINLTTEPKGYKDLAGWSPDGNWILFNKTNFYPRGKTIYPNQEEIWIVKFDGSESHFLGNGYADDVFWGPEGDFIVFPNFSEPEGQPDAYYIYYLEQGKKEKLFSSGNIWIDDFSPNGNFVFYNSNQLIDSRKHKIYSWPQDYSLEIYQACENNDYRFGSSIWFPDATENIRIFPCGIVSSPSNIIVLIRTKLHEDEKSYIIESIITWPDNRGLIDISSNGLWILGYEFDNDLKCIIFDNNLNEIFKYDCNLPKWSPDGNHLLDYLKYENKWAIVAIEAGGDVHQITKIENLEWLTNYKDTAEWGLWLLQPRQ